MFDTLRQDVRYALRRIRRAPLFSATVAATIGLGLGILGSAVTILNAYVLRPVDLPDPRALVALSWDTDTVRRHRFSLTDLEAARESGRPLVTLAGATAVQAMQDGDAMPGLLVTGDYFQLLGARAARGRTLQPPDDAPGTGGHAVLLSHRAWVTRHGSDPSIIGKTLTLARQRFDVVGVMPEGYGMPGEELVSFWVPLSAASTFLTDDPRTEPLLSVVGRLRAPATRAQVRAWLEVWLKQRFPPGTASAPLAVWVESRATRLPLTDKTLTMMTVILSAFGLVLLVACANVTNLMLARTLTRQRELAVRMSLGSSRWRIVCQVIVESLVLAVPAALVGLGLTAAAARLFPVLVAGTFPEGVGPIDALLFPADPDARVMTVLFVAAALSAVLVSLAPALRMVRADLVRASRGEAGWDTRRSRLRTTLVALQIGACALFLIGATGLVGEARRLANSQRGLSYERVAGLRLDARLRTAVAAQLAADPAVDGVAAAWEPPMIGPLPTIGVVASDPTVQRAAGFTVVSPDYFALFDIGVVRGRIFTAREADDAAPVALVSATTAQVLWPGLDPIGRTLQVLRSDARPSTRRLTQTSVRIIGVTEDVITGSLLDGVDGTCIYFPTGPGAPGEMSLLVRARGDAAALRPVVTAAVNAVEPDAPFRFFTLRQMLGGLAWIFGAFSATASLLGGVGLLIAFSGTYAVVAFLVAQRTREFGVRMALGATVARIVKGILADTLRTAAIGLAGGVAVAMALARALGSAMEVLPSFGAHTYAIGIAIVLGSTVIAGLLPSLRAARIDPSQALRVE